MLTAFQWSFRYAESKTRRNCVNRRTSRWISDLPKKKKEITLGRGSLRVSGFTAVSAWHKNLWYQKWNPSGSRIWGYFQPPMTYGLQLTCTQVDVHSSRYQYMTAGFFVSLQCIWYTASFFIEVPHLPKLFLHFPWSSRWRSSHDKGDNGINHLLPSRGVL